MAAAEAPARKWRRNMNVSPLALCCPFDGGIAQGIFEMPLRFTLRGSAFPCQAARHGTAQGRRRRRVPIFMGKEAETLAVLVGSRLAGRLRRVALPAMFEIEMSRQCEVTDQLWMHQATKPWNRLPEK
ncbi:hypothetical protein ACFQU7_15045 [Pseudoroseomonas wenyumeiae]